MKRQEPQRLHHIVIDHKKLIIQVLMVKELELVPQK